MWSEDQEAEDRGASQEAELAESPDGAVRLAAKLANVAALSALADAGCSLDSPDEVPSSLLPALTFLLPSPKSVAVTVHLQLEPSQ